MSPPFDFAPWGLLLAEAFRVSGAFDCTTNYDSTSAKYTLDYRVAMSNHAIGRTMAHCGYHARPLLRDVSATLKPGASH